jgi:RluA family pseudouridine synthase
MSDVSSTSPRWTDHRVTADEAGRTVQEILTDAMHLSRRMIQKLTRSRGIQLNRRPAFLGRRVRAGDRVSVRMQEEEPRLEPVAMDLSILHEDEEILAVAKPPFLLVHPTRPEQTRTLAHGVAFHLQRHGVRARVRPVHRIDRDTSGVVLFAKSAVAHARLDTQLRERTLKREYLAWVRGIVEPSEGGIDAPIGRHPRNPQLRAVRPDGEPALTRYRTEERYAAASLLRLELDTGRTHQIRVHLAHRGHPLLGDRPYGGAGPGWLRRQALHASWLSFVHPFGGEPITLEAPLPQDLVRLQRELREANGTGAAGGVQPAPHRSSETAHGEDDMPDERQDSMRQGIGAPPESPAAQQADAERQAEIARNPSPVEMEGAMGGTSDVDSPGDEADLDAALGRGLREEPPAQSGGRDPDRG